MTESTSFTGADLRKMRLRLKMSQAAFGTAIGVHENTIARYEQNPQHKIVANNVVTYNLVSLCKYLFPFRKIVRRKRSHRLPNKLV